MGMIKIPEKAILKFNKNYASIFKEGSLAEGVWNERLSTFYKKYVDSLFAVPFASNGSGILAVLLLLKKYYGYENIFIQSNTMYGVKAIAITSGLNYVGSVDCKLDTLMPSTQQVEVFIDKIASSGKTIFLMSHLGGIVNPDIIEIVELCNKKNIAIVEDCAHSLGATINGLHSGKFGIAGVYSLYATKAISAGEGGIVVTNDHRLGEMLNKFQIYDRFDQIQEIGVNFRISELQALFSLCVSEQSEEIIKNKYNIAKRYADICIKNNIRFIDSNANGQRGNHYKFTLLAKTSNLEFEKIKSRTSPIYDYSIGNDFESISNKHICLPIWYGLEEELIQKTLLELESLKY